MFVYRGHRLHKVVYFEDAHLDLDWKGTTFISGINRNARSHDRTNGVGKTLLVSPISHLAFGDPMGLPRNLSRHSLLTEPGSEIEWRLAAQGSEWVIVKRRTRAKSGRIEWSMHRDGMDVKPRTSTIAEQMVADLMPFSEDEFTSLVYLDSRRQSSLLMGTATTRQTYLTGLLRVDEYGRVREYLRARHAVMKDLSIRRDELSSVVKDVNKADVAALEEELTRLRSRLDKATEEARRLKSRMVRRRLFEQHQDDLALTDGFDMARYYEVREMEKEWLLKDRQNAEYASYAKLRKQWMQELRKLLDVAGIEAKSAKAAAKFVGDNLGELEGRVRVQTANASRRESLEEELKGLKQDSRRAGRIMRENFSSISDTDGLKIKLRGELTGALAKRRVLMERVDHLAAHVESGDGECQVCGSRLKPARALELLEDAKRESAELPLKRMQNKLDRLEEANVLWNPKQLARAREITKRLRVLDADDPNLPNLLQAYRNVAVHLTFEPRPVPKPSDGDPVEMSMSEVESYLDDAEPRARAWANVKAVRDKAMSGGDLPPHATLKERFEKANAHGDRLSGKIASVQVNLSVARKDAARVEKAGRRIRSMDRKLRDRPILERLLDAYGPKGLRMAVLRDASSRICSNLNRFAPLLFPEKMEFSARLSDGNLDFHVTRFDGRTSDIRHMSGAESRLFSLVWLLGVLPLVPESRRCNMVVLDEFEANLDQVTRDLLVNEYLPALNEVVPHVVFLTPNTPPEPGRGRRLLTVVKEGDASTVTAA